MDPDSACRVNLGPKERRKRLLTGVGGFLGGGALAAWFLITSTGPDALYFLVFIPFFVGSLGLFQALAGT